MNELITKSINELLTPSDIDVLVQFDEYAKRVELIKDSIKEQLMNIIKEHHLEEEGIETDLIKVTYVKPSITKKVDYKGLIDDGLYDAYVTEVPKKDFVRISVKYEE